MKRLLVLILMFATVSLHAQKGTFWQKVNTGLTVIKNIDTVYIYHPKQGFTLGIFSTLQEAGFNMRVKFKINFDDNETIESMTKYGLSGKLSSKLGLELGYGKLVLGYGIEIGPKNAYKRKAFAFNILGKAWGVHFSYFNITNRFVSSIEVENKGVTEQLYNELVENLPKGEIVSTEPATMKSLSIDAYYIFNNKKFAYPAAYKASLIQRRTAGSWMVTARYTQGSIYNSPEASMDNLSLLDCFSTLQVSLGGGYSANIVCWHKDPTKGKDKGLRNLTLNLTALPVLTMIDYMKTTSYQYDDDGELTDPKKSKVFCYPMPNFIGSAAFGLTLDRFLLSAQFTYNWFFFLSSNAYNSKKLQISDYVDDISFRGSFHNWNLKLLFTYKF